VTAFVNHGQNGLIAKATPGRPPKLNEDQMRRIAFWVREYSPNQLSFDFGLWTLRLIGLLIERELKVKLSLPTLGKVMHTLGFSPQRPLHRAWEQDAALVQAWRSEVLPGLCWPALSEPEHSCTLPTKLAFVATTTPAPLGSLLVVRPWCAKWALE
jgi:transposase